MSPNKGKLGEGKRQYRRLGLIQARLRQISKTVDRIAIPGDERGA